jgi:protein ImuA
MRVISCRDGKLQELAEVGLKVSGARGFRSGVSGIDELAPEGALVRGAVHEILSEAKAGEGKFFAAVMARAACGMGDSPMSSMKNTGGSPVALPLVWCDPKKELYPPALASLGIDLRNVYVLHPKDEADEAWAVAECLKCRGVGAVIASPGRLSRVVARKLQLAAEVGGTVGILLRPVGRGSEIYAAATRWLVAPCPGERTVQRWKVTLIHGHGGRVGESVFLEHCRETNSVRAVEKLGDRSVEAAPARRAASA